MTRCAQKPRLDAVWNGELRTRYVPQLHPKARAALADGWTVYGTSAQRGFCTHRWKWISVPVWVKKHGEGYTMWYLSHECAHVLTRGHNHDDVFMKALIEICPPEHVHHELGYKPRNASAAGIRLPERANEENPLTSALRLKRALKYVQPKPKRKHVNPNTQKHVDELKAIAWNTAQLVLYYDKTLRMWRIETPSGVNRSYFTSRELAGFTDRAEWTQHVLECANYN